MKTESPEAKSTRYLGNPGLDRIKSRMAHWPGAKMRWIEGGKHEVLMESTAIRKYIFKQISQFFVDHAQTSNTAQQAVRVSRPA